MLANRIYLILGLMITLISFNTIDAYCQDINRYNLNEVIKLAQDQSPDAQKAKHTFRYSYWSYRFFKAEYLPLLEFNAKLPNFNRSFNEISSADDGSISYIFQTSSNYDVNLNLSQKIGLTGGDVFLSSGVRRLDNFYTTPDTSTTSYVANMVNVGVSQPLFSYNAYKWLKKIEPMKYEEAKRAVIETNEEIASNAVDYFFSLLIAQLERKIAHKNYSNYDTLYKIALGRYTLGKIAENELLQLELNLLKAKASVESSELNYENRLFLFKSYLRIKGDQEIELIPPSITPDFIVNPELAIKEAESNSSQGIAFKRRLIEAESDVNRAKKEGRFDAEIYAVFGLTQSSDILNQAYKNPLDEERVEIGITVPILDWGKAKGRIKMAESNQDLEITAVEQEIIDFKQNVFINVMEYNMQKNQLMIAAKSDTVAQKRYEVTQKRYMIGKINDVLELSNAQVDNDNAKVGYYRALLSFWRSYYSIRRLTLFDFQRKIPITVNTDDLLQ